MLPDLDGKHVVLLQGPMGPFFGRFAADLRARGARVTKVNFNAGDALFYRGEGVIAYRGTPEAWPAFFRDLLTADPAAAVFLFGDCRPIHAAAIPVARELGAEIWVFEEGYLRPDWITLERGGVNGNSSLPRDPEYYRTRAAKLPEPAPPIPVGATFRHAALQAIAYSIAMTFGWWRYPHYRHHRSLNAFAQAFYWCRSGLRKLWYRSREAGILERAQGDWAGKYFFVPLQVHCDAQLRHSPYPDIPDFIEEVVRTFAESAPADTLLVLKHHPQDRAYRDYTRLVAELSARHGLAGRLVYCHDQHLPTLLRHARGTITMNSTVGLSSLYHHTPTIVLGTAIYDLPGLTHQGSLASFFQAPSRVDPALHDAFCRVLRADNQLNGSFYKRLPGGTGGASGIALTADGTHRAGERSAWPGVIRL